MVYCIQCHSPDVVCIHCMSYGIHQMSCVSILARIVPLILEYAVLELPQKKWGQAVRQPLLKTCFFLGCLEIRRGRMVFTWGSGGSDGRARVWSPGPPGSHYVIGSIHNAVVCGLGWNCTKNRRMGHAFPWVTDQSVHQMLHYADATTSHI